MGPPGELARHPLLVLAALAVVTVALVGCRCSVDARDREGRADHVVGALAPRLADGSRGLFLISGIEHRTRFAAWTTWRLDLVDIHQGHLRQRLVLPEGHAAPHCRPARPGRLWCVDTTAAGRTLAMRDAATLAVVGRGEQQPLLADFHRARVDPKDGSLVLTVTRGDRWQIDATTLAATRSTYSSAELLRLPPLENSRAATTSRWHSPRGVIHLADAGDSRKTRLLRASSAGQQDQLRPGFLVAAAFLRRNTGPLSADEPVLGARGQCAVLVYRTSSARAAPLTFECLDPEGQARWSLAAPAGDVTFAEQDQGTLLVVLVAPDQQSYALAIDVETGTRRWRFDI